MTKKYCKLKTQETFDSNFGVYGTKTQAERRSNRASVRSFNSNERGLSGHRQNPRAHAIQIIKASQSKTIGEVPVSLLTNLFNAKCKDLALRPKDGQLRRFYDFCSTSIIGRKYLFREIGLGANSAKVLGTILRLNKCSHLDLRKNVLGNNGLKELAKSMNTNSSVIHVDIGSNDITFEGANSFFLSLRKHKTLTSISIANSDGLHRNRIGHKGCIGLNDLLRTNKLISMLNISDNNIGNEGIRTLLNELTPESMNLIYLNLTNNDLGTDCIKEMKTLFESEVLQELRLGSNSLNDTHAEDLSLFFYRQVCQLRKIDLSNNKITSKGGRLLFQAIKQNQFLTHLNLENNSSLGDGDLTELKHLFNNNEYLQSLNMSGCGIESYHVKEIVEGLYAKHAINSRTGNNTLQYLNLSNNRIMGDGAMHFVTIIENNTNTGIRKLDLSKNSITDEAGIALAKALETNTCIIKLSLKNNFLSDGAGMAICIALQKNKTIVKIPLDKNSIKMKYIIEIREHL